MNKFIVWDKERKMFITDSDIQLFDICLINTMDGKIVNISNESFDETDYKPLKYIGIKDISNKKIYADCSIFEFDKCSQDGHSEQLKGFIRESSPMIFQLVVLDNDIWNVLYWHEFRHSIKNLKIIDTIQENKLGLIKP